MLPPCGVFNGPSRVYPHTMGYGLYTTCNSYFPPLIIMTVSFFCPTVRLEEKKKEKN